MFTKSVLRWALCSLVFTAFGQESRFGGPVSGLVFDGPSKSLRQILGMAGAARLGTPLLSDLDWASVAPNGGTVIVVAQGEARALSAADLAQGSSGATINGILDAPVLSVWAADSSAVALYSASARSVQWVRLTAQGPVADLPVALTGIDGDVTALAADQSSGLVVLAVAGAGVYRASADGVAQILPLADVSAIALETGGHTLWIADRTNAQLLQVADPASNSEAQILLTDVDRLADISALGVSSDNKALYVANRSTLRVYLMNRENTELSEAVELDAPVTAFTPLTRPSFFLLGQRSKPEEPFYVMDEGAGRAIFFIPAGEAR